MGAALPSGRFASVLGITLPFGLGFVSPAADVLAAEYDGRYDPDKDDEPNDRAHA